MPELSLVIRCSGSRKDPKRFLGNIEDYAEEQFEMFTTFGIGRHALKSTKPMSMVSWIEPSEQQEKLHMALAEILEWYDDLPNDTFDAMPAPIKRARRLIPEREK